MDPQQSIGFPEGFVYHMPKYRPYTLSEDEIYDFKADAGMLICPLSSLTPTFPTFPFLASLLISSEGIYHYEFEKDINRGPMSFCTDKFINF